MPYVRRFSQEMDEDVIHSHISLYVNDFSVDLGKKGRNAIARLKKMIP
jgi:1,4-dihydroxy-6-naphthoate synthase